MPIGPSDQPNAEQKRWRELLLEQGSILSGNSGRKIEVHHPLGVTAQVKTEYGQQNIGHWFLNVLTEDEHYWLGNDLNRFKACLRSTGLATSYNGHSWDIDSMIRLEIEKMCFFLHIAQLVCNGMALEINVPGAALEAIAGYRK